MTTVEQARRELQQKLSAHLEVSEARAMAYIIVEDVMGYTGTQMLVNAEREIEPMTLKRMHSVADRVIGGEPLQYVLGAARLRGREFMVNPSVLIPRPETGQLIDMIVDRHRHSRDRRVLDIGTGSGCIAISLALDLPYAQVDAIDISAPAVDVANANAKALKAQIRAAVVDVYKFKESRFGRQDYDIIVSNPPYVLNGERECIDPRVKDHEPEIALFVDDDEPIAIYEAIADVARRQLVSGGWLYLEINPLCDKYLKAMLERKGLDDVVIVRDYRGYNRFAIARQR